MKANVIAATLLAAFSVGAFAQRDANVPGGPGPADGKFPTGFPIGPDGPKPTDGKFPTGFPAGPGGPKPTGFPGFPVGPGGPKPTGPPGGGFPGFPPQVPGAAQPSGGFGHHSGFRIHTRKSPKPTHSA
ncbi:hypothetical protein CGRA01v4_04360 [Colletotrichum graminicola]|uniref:Uncharacterized protein n=1 Tax=Colletotrichum graminicola (strain M1.001 / M2 / FGSC 10212) TaxID=645133 RepID=E3Q9C0_COLGM|nr:uncharacterized protein GLRG_01794 [Colletotrichum graminicola M1.001]EFQ27299.1 hypothetical protein GLRG_01794 [Colletotrichum graminicola M1.001]WDK13079.1 hypothetical protein CGRA01v4_04360 [Colletotrichum graminicola]